MSLQKSAKTHKIFDSVSAYIKLVFSSGGFKRLLVSWFLISAICLAGIKTVFTDMGFFTKVKLPMFILCVVFIWLMLCEINNEKLINALLLLSAASLAVFAAYERSDIFFLIGLCASVSLVIMFTATGGLIPKRIDNPYVKWSVTVVLALALTVTVGLWCCMRYRDHWTSCYDFGIFSQMYYYMKETGLPLATCERDGLLSHFAVHVSPAFYILLPIYALFPFPETLLIAQIMIVVSGVFPLLLICKKLGLTSIESLLFAICYLAYPSFTGGSFFYFHENCFLAPLIMWLIYFCMCDNTVMSLIFTVLLLSVKEDAAVYAAVIALYFLFSKKSKKSMLTSFCMLLVSIIYFMIITHILSIYGDGAMTWRYSNYIYDGSGSLITLFKAIAANPVYVISQCFTQDKLIFTLQMLIPLGFLPLMMKSPKGLIMLIPFVLINLMTNYAYQYNIGYQYTFGSGCALIFISAVNYGELKTKAHSPKKILATASICAVILMCGIHSHRLSYFEQYQQNAYQRETIDYALSLVPDNASVCSTTFLLPNLSQRDEIYQLESTKKKAEYYVLDLRYKSDIISVNNYPADRYETVYIQDGIIAIFKDTQYSE